MEGNSRKVTRQAPAPNNYIQRAIINGNCRSSSPPPPPCQDVSKYEQVKVIGQGSYGTVFEAYQKCCPENLVALKKVTTTKETERFALREIHILNLLKLFKHPNIVDLIEVCRPAATLKNIFTPIYFMVLELCDYDLHAVVKNPNLTIGVSEIKGVIKQMLDGLYFIHEQNIMHRDLKPANILITKSGVLKLADFGMAIPFDDPNTKPDKPPIVYSPGVCTRWYRAPEILLGATDYGPAIDMWSAGCIMGEMFERKAILRGQSDPDQIMKISNLCGPITPEVWPEVVKTPLFKRVEMPEGLPRNLVNNIQNAARTPEALDLLDKLLVLDPSQRINADAAWNHDFFWTNPMPCDLQHMITRHTETVNIQQASSPRKILRRPKVPINMLQSQLIHPIIRD